MAGKVDTIRGQGGARHEERGEYKQPEKENAFHALSVSV